MIKLFTFFSIVFGMGFAWAGPVPDPAYERLFPHYAEICGLGKYNGGNFGGHTLLYVKGVCRDRDSALPRVRRCSAQELEAQPHLGTGLSVDPISTNAHWYAVEDLNFVLFFAWFLATKRFTKFVFHCVYVIIIVA